MNGSERTRDLLIYIGAGGARSLQAELQRARRVILVDADEKSVSELQDRFGENDRVEIFEAALGTASEDVPFYRFNMRKFNGFHLPDALMTAYPGLKVLEESVANKQDAAEFIKSVRRRSEVDLELVVDANGDEIEILDSLGSSPLAQQVDAVTLHSGSRPLFRDGFSAESVAARLKELGFAKVDVLGAGNFRIVRGGAEHSLADSDERTRLRSRIVELERQVERVEGKEREVAQALDLSEEKRARLETEIATLKAESVAAGRAEAGRAEGLRAQLDQQRQRSEQLAERNRELMTQISDLESRAKDFQLEANRQTTSLSEARDALAEADLAREALEVKVANLEERVEAVTSDLAVALRQQALKAQDLRELQDQYRALSELKSHQDGLLERLHHRLNEAAVFLATDAVEDTDQSQLER